MNIDFSDQDLLYIYMNFQKLLNETEDFKSAQNISIDKKSINQEIKLCSSIVDKIEKACPNISKLNLKA